MSLRETLTNTWNHIQGFLFPMLREEVGPLTAQHERLIIVGLTASPRGVWARGRAGIGISFWWGRASGVRSPFSRKEIPNVTVAYADDRRHDAGGFIAGNASHLH